MLQPGSHALTYYLTPASPKVRAAARRSRMAVAWRPHGGHVSVTVAAPPGLARPRQLSATPPPPHTPLQPRGSIVLDSGADVFPNALAIKPPGGHASFFCVAYNAGRRRGRYTGRRSSGRYTGRLRGGRVAVV